MCGFIRHKKKRASELLLVALLLACSMHIMQNAVRSLSRYLVEGDDVPKNIMGISMAHQKGARRRDLTWAS